MNCSAIFAVAFLMVAAAFGQGGPGPDTGSETHATRKAEAEVTEQQVRNAKVNLDAASKELDGFTVGTPDWKLHFESYQSAYRVWNTLNTRYEAQENAKEATQISATCREVYAATADRKVSDLTVKETELVKACQTLGAYAK